MREAGVAVEIEGAWTRGGIDADSVRLWIMAILSFSFVGAVLLGLI